MFASAPLWLLAVGSALVQQTYGKAVFAHYMLGGITEEHAHKDIDDAIALGLDGFALNIGDPTLDWVKTTLSHLYGYAAYRGFKLFVSMDLYASGASCSAGGSSCNGPFDYQWIWDAYKGNDAYYRVNGKSLISTFSSGGFTKDKWTEWKSSLANDMYFMPDFDETDGYYAGASGWWDYWGSVVDGIFSWESAWPQQASSETSGDVSKDLVPLKAAKQRSKGYMIGLSSLQYKDAYGANVYRRGDLNLPIRMNNILTMDPQPDFVEFLTWNDGPESHYIGNLWTEQNGDAAPAKYATQAKWDHTGWQPLLASFIKAYKNDKKPTEMEPASGTAVGAMWYKAILTESVSCPSDTKPPGFLDSENNLFWSVVLSPSAGSGWTVTVDAGGQLTSTALKAGLNYGKSAGKITAGAQRIDLVGPSGKVMSTNGGMCVSSGCPTGIYASNYQVVQLTDGEGPATKTCTAW